MSAVVAALELLLPTKEMRQFEEKETCVPQLGRKRGRHRGTEAGGPGSEYSVELG